MANERRASYDYFMMICGPLLAKAWTTSPLGLLDFFADARSATVSEERRIASVILLASKIIWCVGVVCWFVIRYPHARRSRRTSKARIVGRGLERFLLMISTTGLGILPALFVFSDILEFADYPIQFWQPWLGLLVFAFALGCFAKRMPSSDATGRSPWRSRSTTA